MITIAHAGGGIKEGKQTYLNSKEGFIMAYKRGIRVFEFDIMLTSDNQIIATHMFEEYGKDLTSMKLPRVEYNKSIDFRDILGLMEAYPDAIILLDTKEMDYNTINIYEIVHNQANTRNPELVKRIIPQIYNEATYKHVETHCQFEQYIFATYKTKLGRKDIQNIVNKYPKITAVTVPGNKFKSFMLALFKGKNNVYVYTINSRFLRFIARFFRVDGVYSDYLKK